jgi:AhpD family alkylhydroperoxidase
MARIAPLPAAQWSPDLIAFLQGFRKAVVGDEPADSNQSGRNLLGTLARHPDLAIPFLGFNQHLLANNTLSTRHRELMILRVAHRRQCDYEWAQHVILGERAGITADEIGRIGAGPDAAEWNPLDRALLRATDELLDHAAVSDPVWQALAAELTERQLMDLVFTVGTYALVAMALRGFEVEPESQLEPYLPVRH